jgi:hypothetical protein
VIRQILFTITTSSLRHHDDLPEPPGIKIFVGPDDVNVALLSRKALNNPEKLTGVFIRDQMVIVMKALKKAIAYGNEYLSSAGQ